MNVLFLLATDIPRTIEWGPQVAIVMILCNIVAIALGKAFMRDLKAGPTFAPQYQKYFGGMGLPAVLGGDQLGAYLWHRCNFRSCKSRHSLS